MREEPPVTTRHLEAPARREPLAEFAADVRHYLTQTPRQIPSRYLYDALGSALFAAICELPWYGITRAEQHLLVEHRSDVWDRLPGLTRMVELGPGDGHKLRTLIDAAPRRGAPLTAHLIDMSASALATATRTFAEVEDVRVVTHEASFDSGLDEVARLERDAGRTLVLSLGSNIGNFDAPAAIAFVKRIRASVAPHDALLIGVDLVKPERQLLLAYDDPLGVSAAFNRNLLVRLNRELGADFDLAAFDHNAGWNGSESRMEMYLVAQRARRVRVPAAHLDFCLRAGEPIWTESSYKYEPNPFAALVERAGFRALTRWIETKDRFALMLFEAD